MENKEIASYFKLTGQLMELHEENKFKVRTYINAAFQVSKYADPIEDMDPDYYGTIPGIGNSLIPKLEEILDTGKLQYLEEWLRKTPDGVLEMLQIKGLGPSKVRTIWKEMGVESPGELLYACNENRLVDLKGFGEKTQLAVKLAIEFMMEHKNSFLYASIEPLIHSILEEFKKSEPNAQIEIVGDAARRTLIVDKLEFVVANAKQIISSDSERIKVAFTEVPAASFEMECFKRSAHESHKSKLVFNNETTVEELYRNNGMGIIPIEMREGRDEFEWIKHHDVSDLIADKDLRGCLHNHTTYSDGIHSLAEMANYLKGLGYEYLGICDHSQTAVYAGGLTVEDVMRQSREIDELNGKMAPFRILKGIESDILPNGDLDYEDDILSSFDFIVASIHSAMKMDEEKATARLIKAIENPFTKILGHPTGRLLLSRPGYPINHRKVIDACAANDVCIELNANPMRLDIDWTWIPYCMEKGVMVSINPDAHRKEGFHHMRYGVMAARKGGLIKEMCFNALNLKALSRKWSID